MQGDYPMSKDQKNQAAAPKGNPAAKPAHTQQPGKKK